MGPELCYWSIVEDKDLFPQGHRPAVIFVVIEQDLKNYWWADNSKDYLKKRLEKFGKFLQALDGALEKKRPKLTPKPVEPHNNKNF